MSGRSRLSLTLLCSSRGGYVVVDGVGRVERTERVLPYHLYALAIVQQGGALVELLQIPAPVENGPLESLKDLGDDLGDGVSAGSPTPTTIRARPR